MQLGELPGWLVSEVVRLRAATYRLKPDVLQWQRKSLQIQASQIFKSKSMFYASSQAPRKVPRIEQARFWQFQHSRLQSEGQQIFYRV
jgi:hypothetical protein